MSTWKLRRTRQCAKCPWKVSTDPRDIPNGYSEALHEGLRRAVAEPGALRGSGVVMACHESKQGREAHCIGWLVHQLGPGNNIPLRIKMMSCANAKKVRTVGEQHRSFDDTLPKDE